MSDADLRELERALAQAPDDTGLLRQHAQLLRRHGQADRALASLDLAWRLGDEELRPELEAELERRSFELLGLRFRYVPAGPFVMGLDDFDEDASPAHLVRLSAFWISETPLLRVTLKDSDVISSWVRDWLRENPEHTSGQFEFVGNRHKAQAAIDYLADQARAAGLPPGTFDMPSEAQWERAFRASLLDPGGRTIYGLEQGRSKTVEWVADRYSSTAYTSSSRFDPRNTDRGSRYVVRGVALRSAELFPIYRDAADLDCVFQVGSGKGRGVAHEHGICLRAVLNPA